MDSSDRGQIEKALRRIPAQAWNDFLATGKGKKLEERLKDVDSALGRKVPVGRMWRTDLPARLPDLLGYGLMQHGVWGPWIREQLLRKASRPVWGRVLATYSSLPSTKTARTRINASRTGLLPTKMAAHWLQGGRWAEAFCEAFNLPNGVWQRHRVPLVNDEEIIPTQPLPPLHDYQRSAYDRLRKLLAKRARGQTALLSLPTGAGKTRVIVEAICDHLAEAAEESTAGGAVLWIAHSAELQMQAWECFRDVWQAPPQRDGGEAPIRRVQPLALTRMWGGRDIKTLRDTTGGPEVLIASVDQLASWAKRAPEVLENLRSRKLLCAVIDEAHGVITQEFREVLEALGLKKPGRWLPLKGAPLLVGLTATPWRRAEEQFKALKNFFNYRLVTPDLLGTNPVERLQDRQMLSKVTQVRIKNDYVRPLTDKQLEHVARFKELPPEYVERLGRNSDRNQEIVKKLLAVKESSRTLVFACSIAHAELLAACLNSELAPGVAVAVTSATPRSERALVIEQFRSSAGPRYLCTVGVLAAGFDAPQVDVVVITRPTMSAALYEQMVGRGLRGPKNGGTRSCRVMDVQDKDLPTGVLSYARVLEDWTGA